jgi:hypothetical protein
MNLYIGTDGDGYGAGSLPLAAQSPYGAFRLGADTSDILDLPITFDHFGGYQCFFPYAYGRCSSIVAIHWQPKPVIELL